MNVETYKLKKMALLLKETRHRVLCPKCFQPHFGCYCALINPFDPKMNFVILIHPMEAKRRIATGRMSHLCLKNSHFIKGTDFTDDVDVNALLKDTEYTSFILCPGPTSINMSLMTDHEKHHLVPQNKKLRVFVIDGTWATAGKMLRESENLKTLPRLCFTLQNPSNFRVRKQPKRHCYSTIEAIHHTIDLLGDSQGFSRTEQTHDRLLSVFNSMVERQLQFIETSKKTATTSTYRRVTE